MNIGLDKADVFDAEQKVDAIYKGLEIKHAIFKSFYFEHVKNTRYIYC